jgi:hypothetical protein
MDPVGQTGDEIVPDETTTYPPELAKPKPKSDDKQKIFRIHPNDDAVMKVLLKKDRLSLQKFIAYCVRGYMDADPYMLKFLKLSRERDFLPSSSTDNGILSHRERKEIFDQLEALERQEKESKK